MTDIAEDSRPNLKICIDNTDTLDSDVEQESADDYVPKVSLHASSDDDAMDDKQESMDILEVPESETPTQNLRVYKNEGMVSGFDMTTKEMMAKKEQRAKRFGINYEKEQDLALISNNFDLSKLYQSLGVTALDLSSGERGIRLEAIHFRGADEMSTQDVFKYFQAHAPSTIEWIDDSNIVWLNKEAASRALTALSYSVEELEEMERHQKDTKQIDVSPAEEAMEEDDINLLDSDDEEKLGIKRGNKSADKIKSKNAQRLGEVTPLPISDWRRRADSMPPGRWRLGVPTDRVTNVFLRFAMKADRKQKGAERRSQYYKKFGNPNFRNQTGIISGSRRRKEFASRAARESAEAKEALQKHARGELVTLEDDLFSGADINTLEDKIYSEKRVQNRKRPLSETKEPQDEKSDNGTHENDPETEELEAEVRLLLGDDEPRAKQKRIMRMHADDEQERLDKIRGAVVPETAPLPITVEVSDPEDSEPEIYISKRAPALSRLGAPRRQGVQNRLGAAPLRRGWQPQHLPNLTIQVDMDDR